MTDLRPATYQRLRIVTALVIAAVVLSGSILVTIYARTGGFRRGISYEEGAILDVSPSMEGGISVVGDNVQIFVESNSQEHTTVRLDTAGFREDTRASAHTVGLRVDSSVGGATNQITVTVPTGGTLVLTLVGEARMLLDRVQLHVLRLTGASAALEMDVSIPGSIVDSVTLDGIAGDFRGVRLGNLNFSEFIIGSVAGNYDLDLSGALERHGDVVVRSALGDGVIRVPSKPGAEIRIGSVLGRVTATGLSSSGTRSFFNTAASLGAEHQLFVDINSTIGKIQLLEVQ
jgi:hypothetical protein